MKRAHINPSDLILMFFLGYCEISVKESAEKVFSFLLSRGARFTRVKNADGGVSMRIYLSRKRSLISMLKQNGIAYSAQPSRGIPALIFKASKMYGLLIGLVFMTALLIISERTVWSISVSGTERLHDAEIISDLAEYGIKLGAFIPSLDTDKICTDYLLENKDVSWIRINAVGNSLEIRLLEKSVKPNSDEDFPSNLIAACDGLIYRVELLGGQRTVSGGESVLKGQVLVSGLVENENTTLPEFPVEDPTYRFERSAGKVFAITNETITVKIPMTYTQKRYTGQIYEKKSIIFFSKPIKFSVLGRNFETNYDIMEVYEHLRLSDDKTLPVSVKKTLYKEYVTETVPLTEKEASRIAEKELSEKISDLLGVDGVLVSKKLSESCDGEFYTVTCSLSCIRDIAIEVPIFSSDKDKIK